MSDLENGTGRVTLALLQQQNEHLAAVLNEVRADVKTVCAQLAKEHDRVTRLESCTKTHTEQIKGLGDDVDDLDRRDKRWNSLNSFGVLLASILGSVLGNNP